MRIVGSAVNLPESRSGWHLLLAVPLWASYLTNPSLRLLTSKIELVTVVPCGPVVSSVHINTYEMVKTGLANSRAQNTLGVVAKPLRSTKP